jgi:hypothetical protein
MHEVLLLKDFLVNAGLSSLNEKRERERELYIYISAERARVREKKIFISIIIKLNGIKYINIE